HPGFRYGTFTLMLLAMGQVAFLFVLSVVLQDGQHLSAVETGLWLVPSGLFIVAGSQLGSWLTRRVGTTNVVRTGLLLEALGLAAVALALSSDIHFWQLLPGFALFGTGIGFAGAQLNNVILSDIPPERAGAASGANTTVRMIGSALGISIISAILSTQLARHAEVAHAAKLPLSFGAVVVFVATGLSLLIPQVGPRGSRQAAADDEAAAESEAMAESIAVQ
ncbi:MAG TPA: MFS transporter, partial [Acidimicrobiales bacterium]|nr:MFS transporter [Acidimicrobiales bacterium]